MCKQEGKVAQAKKGQVDLPQGAGAPCQGGLQQDQELFWLNSSGLVTWPQLGVI